MKSTLRVENPDDIEFTMTLTMNLRDWKLLSRQLSNHYPSWKLSEQISNLVYRAEQVFSNQAYDGDKASSDG